MENKEKTIPLWKVNMNIRNELAKLNRSKELDKRLRNQEFFQNAPSGYKVSLNENGIKTIVIDEEIAPIIKELFETYANNPRLSMWKCGLIIIEKYPVVNSFISNRGSLSRLIKNKFYIGLMSLPYISKSVNHYYPRIISEDLWNKCNERIRITSKERGRCEFALYRSRIKCGICLKNVTHTQYGSRSIYYVCTRSKDISHDTIQKSVVEKSITNHLQPIMSQFNVNMDEFYNNSYKRNLILSLIFKNIYHLGELFKWELNNELSIEELKNIIGIICASKGYQAETFQLIHYDDKLLNFLIQPKNIYQISDFLEKDPIECSSVLMDYCLEDKIEDLGGVWKTKS